jgi:hypothetical protein
MLSYLTISAFFLLLILLVRNAGRYKPINYLGFFFLFVILYAINQYVVLYSKSVFLVALFYTNFTVISYLIGPTLYWYVRCILTDNYHLKRRDLWHLLPALVYLSAALPYILTPHSYKLEIASTIVRDVGFLGTFKATFLSEVFSNTAVYLSRPVLILGYTVWSIGLFMRYLMHKSYLNVFSKQYFMTIWLFFLLGFQMVLVVSNTLSIFKTFVDHSNVFFTLNLLQIFSATGLAGLLLSPLFFRGILYGLPRFPGYIPQSKSQRGR